MRNPKFYLKKIIHGYFPLAYATLFNTNPEQKPYYRYIIKHGYKRHLYTFAHEYEDWTPDVLIDNNNGLPYVITRQNKRLYFKRDSKIKKIAKLYKALTKEQDHRSPHCYWQSLDECSKCVLADVGCAEGFSSLEAIEVVNHAYLFESDPEWIEALQATFKPWIDKVTIVEKFVSDKDNERQTTLDTFFSKKEYERLYIKMDIEGAERFAINGASKLLCADNVSFAICTYHNDDYKIVPMMLRNLGINFYEQKGYFNHTLKPIIVKKT